MYTENLKQSCDIVRFVINAVLCYDFRFQRYVYILAQDESRYIPAVLSRFNA